MESVESTNRIDIKEENGPNEQDAHHRFSCVKENGEVKALYKNNKQLTLINSSQNGKLMCEFEVDERILDQKQVTEDQPKAKLQWNNVVASAKNNGFANESGPSAIIANMFCMPSVIVFSQDDPENNKYFKKATYDFGDVTCNDASLKLEFRNESKGNKFEEVESVKCERSEYSKGMYKVVPSGSSVPIEIKDDVDVRCFTDADYFCDYDPKSVPGKRALDRDEPNIKMKKKSQIGCPVTHPFFVIKGRLPIKNATITCQNYYGKMKWTYNGIVLSSTGPEVYCAKELDCKVTHKMNASNLYKSFLDENSLPQCHADEQLRVKEGSEGKEYNVAGVSCDTSAGLYNYFVGSDRIPRTVTSATVFTCFFHDENADANAQTDEMMKDLGFIGAGLGATTFLIGIGIACILKKKNVFSSNKKIKNMKLPEKSNFEIDDAKSGYEQDTSNINDYLKAKREEAKKAALYSIAPARIPVLNRKIERISPELIKLNGKRVAEVKTYVWHEMKDTSSINGMMNPITRQMTKMKEKMEQATKAAAAAAAPAVASPAASTPPAAPAATQQPTPNVQ